MNMGAVARSGPGVCGHRRYVHQLIPRLISVTPGHQAACLRLSDLSDENVFRFNRVCKCCRQD